MKVLITGTEGIALELFNLYKETNDVVMVSRRNGYNIRDIDKWGNEFLDFDVVFNNAYDGFYQVDVLNFFYNNWKNNSLKSIINIGSRCITYKNSSQPEVWPYRLHKQALQTAFDSMISNAKCDIKIINPGPADTKMTAAETYSKFTVKELAEKIKMYAEDRTIKRIDLWL